MKVNRKRKFTNEEAAQIRDEYASGEYSQRALAGKWGVNLSTMKSLLRGKTYGDAGGFINPKYNTKNDLASRVERNERNIAKLMKTVLGIKMPKGGA